MSIVYDGAERAANALKEKATLVDILRIHPKLNIFRKQYLLVSDLIFKNDSKIVEEFKK